LRIGETKDPKSQRCEESIAALVRLLTLDKIVTLTVKLHDQFRRITSKVGDVISDWDLTSKSQTVNSMRPDIAPEQRFSARRGSAKLLRATTLDCAYS
jgi:hypothetical protein